MKVKVEMIGLSIILTVENKSRWRLEFFHNDSPHPPFSFFETRIKNRNLKSSSRVDEVIKHDLNLRFKRIPGSREM